MINNFLIHLRPQRFRSFFLAFCSSISHFTHGFAFLHSLVSTYFSFFCTNSLEKAGIILKDYKSPWAAFLWSIAMPGCGQIYNRDWFLGLLLLASEFIINCKSNLNQAIFLSFHFDLAQARTIIDYQWGLFYPSIYTYALWNAFNRAVENNAKRAEKNWSGRI